MQTLVKESKEFKICQYDGLMFDVPMDEMFSWKQEKKQMKTFHFD